MIKEVFDEYCALSAQLSSKQSDEKAFIVLRGEHLAVETHGPLWSLFHEILPFAFGTTRLDKIAEFVRDTEGLNPREAQEILLPLAKDEADRARISTLFFPHATIPS